MKIVSMTGYGQGVADSDSLTVTVEVKTVNSRFLDFNIKLPHEYNQFEIEVRREVANVLKRGRVDIYISRQYRRQQVASVNFNKPLLEVYLQVFEEVRREFTLNEISFTKESFVQELLLRHEILNSSEAAAVLDSEQELLFLALRKALQDVLIMRKREGERLAENVESLLVELRFLCEKIGNNIDNVSPLYYTRISERLKKIDLGIELDPQRLAMEVAVLADKLDVTEELVRLQSHFAQIEQSCESTPNGRALDFLIQECGREFNTISSKIQNAEIQAIVVSAKGVLEKLREQVQNIE